MSTASAGPLDTKQLEERLRPKIVVGNAGDYPVNAQVGGRFYPVEAGAEMLVTDIQDHKWKKDAAGKRVRDWGNLETTMSALDVAKAIVSEDVAGPKGLFIKVGDPAFDASSRRAARERFLSWQTNYCLGVESGWIAKVAAHAADNPGVQPLRQPRRVKVALAWLAQNAQDADVDRAEFICRTCSNEYDVQGELDAHIRDRHPGLAQDIAAATAEPAEPEPEPNVYDPFVYLAKARELKVNLKKEELEGLIAEDKDVIKVVTEKLAEAAQAAAKKEGARG